MLLERLLWAVRRDARPSLAPAQGRAQSSCGRHLTRPAHEGGRCRQTADDQAQCQLRVNATAHEVGVEEVVRVAVEVGKDSFQARRDEETVGSKSANELEPDKLFDCNWLTHFVLAVKRKKGI